MKILYITDPHIDLQDEETKRLRCIKQFAQERINPDITIVAGDLVNSVFENEDDVKTYLQFFQQASAIKEQELHRKFAVYGMPEPISPYERVCMTHEIARQILEKGYYPAQMRDFSREYLLHLYSTAGQNYEKIYSRILEAMGEDILVIPGNYDTNLEMNYDFFSDDRQGALHAQSVHKKRVEREGLVIAGYGGAAYKEVPFVPVDIPRELTAHFNEYVQANPLTLEAMLVSEPRDFLIEAAPDVAVLHMPPQGLCDFSKANKVHTGSLGLRQYVEVAEPKLVLCGHIHEAMGLHKLEDKDVVIVNAGSFTRGLTGNTGDVGKNSFAVIEMDDETKRVEAVRFYRIIHENFAEDGIFPEATFLRDDLGNFIELTLSMPQRLIQP